MISWRCRWSFRNAGIFFGILAGGGGAYLSIAVSGLCKALLIVFTYLGTQAQAHFSTLVLC